MPEETPQVAKQGAFTFVLHSHLPYCRGAGRWPHGEEWLYEASAETYVPLLSTLYDLRAEGVSFKATIGLTPILVEQLRDPLVNAHFAEYLDERVNAASADGDRHRRTGAGDMGTLADFYEARYSWIRSAYQDRFHGDMVGAFRALQDSGCVEIATSAATHGYLPLFERDSTLAAQIGTGVAAYVDAFGRRPRAIWLPECAYRPAYRAGFGRDAYEKPGIETFLDEQGLRVFFAETQTVEGGRAVGKSAGDAMGLYGRIAPDSAPPSVEGEPSAGTTFEAYRVAAGEVAVLGRNARTGLQVWSAEHGYPGDSWYREFHKKDDHSGLQYWRTTARNADLGAKEAYEPAEAAARVKHHARHFAALVEQEIAGYHSLTGRYGIVAAAYDTELFGHWWFEGVDWLREVLYLLASSEVVDLVTASEFIDTHAPERALALPEGSWGQGGDHSTWMTPETKWMWESIDKAEVRMERIAAQHARADGETLQVLRQAGRELLLLESSDWPFLVTTGQARDYAVERFRSHEDRFNRLAEILEQGPAGLEAARLAASLFEQDRVFPLLDYSLFRDREGRRAGVGSAA
jgi:1,4-alpha-glucan branching enzyme